MKPNNLLTTAKAADIMGVHESSVKRWCNSNKLNTHHTQGGHRRIDWNDLLHYSLKEGLEHPFRVFDDHGLMVYLAKEEFLKKEETTKFLELLKSWINEVNYKYLAPLVSYCFVQIGIPFVRICDELLFPSFCLIGDKWQEKSLCTAEEHRITQEWVYTLGLIRQNILENKMQNAEAPLKALVCCSDENTHEVATLCLRIILEINGYSVIYLGPRVPTEELLVTQSQDDYQLLCISFSPLDTIQELASCLKTLASHYQPSKPYALAIGGGGIQHWVSNPLNEFPFKEMAHFKNMISFEKWIQSKLF